MKLRDRTLIVSLFFVTITAAPNRSAIANPPARCTMSFGGESGFSRGTLVGLGTALPETAPAPIANNAALDVPADSRALRPMASRFSITDVPREIVETFRATLAKSSGFVWVVPWFRNSSCVVESSWLGSRDLKSPHAVLFLTPRPESLWVNGEPTYDAFDGKFTSGAVWERDPKSENPMSLRDLRVFLAVYPRLAGFTSWREGSFLQWALAHRDSGNTNALRGRLQTLVSAHVTDSLNSLPAPLAGVWKGEGVLAGGDSIHFWMELCAAPRRYEWAAPRWGPYPWYSGAADFDSIPMPMQYGLPVEFETARESLRCGGHEWRVAFTVPFSAATPTGANASWAWLAKIAPDARRAEFYRNDSLTTGKLRSNGFAPNATQIMSVNAAGNTLTAKIQLVGIPDSVESGTVARWTAHRVR